MTDVELGGREIVKAADVDRMPRHHMPGSKMPSHIASLQSQCPKQVRN